MHKEGYLIINMECLTLILNVVDVIINYFYFHSQKMKLDESEINKTDPHLIRNANTKKD